MQRLLLFFLLFVLSFNSYSQNHKLDSLVNSLKKQDADSNIYNTCIKIAGIYSDSAYDKSLAYYNKALDIADRSSDRSKVAHVYHQIGYMYQRKGEFPTALTNLNNALQIHEYLKNKKGIGQLLNDIGLIYRTWGKYDKALENYIKALSLFDEIGDVGNGAMSSNNIGQIYYYRAEYDKAIEYFKKYLAVNIKSKSPRAVAGASNNIASAYMELEKYDNAIGYFVRSMRIYDSLGIKLGVAVIKDNMGSLFLRKKQYNDALLYHSDALKYFEETKSLPRLCATLLNVGQVYNKMNKPELAIPHLNRSLDIALQLKQKETQKDVYDALSEVYSQTKNWEKALVNYKLFAQINDSLLNAETIGKIETIQAEYEAQKKEKELSEINQKLQTQKIVLILTGGLFLLFLFMIALFIWENAQKKKTISKSLLETQNLKRLLSGAGQLVLKQQKEKESNSPMFEKNWCLIPIKYNSYPFLTYKKDQHHYIAYHSNGCSIEISNLIYLSIADFLYSSHQVSENQNIRENYYQFISSDTKWNLVFEGTDPLNVDFGVFNKELNLLQYFGTNNAFVVNKYNQIENLADKNKNWLTVEKGDRFYIFTTGYCGSYVLPDLSLLQETLSKTILKTIDISFDEQREIFSNSLELISAGNENQTDIAIFAFLI
jgi:tetratricopeptide (TPR) repeat protein